MKQLRDGHILLLLLAAVTISIIVIVYSYFAFDLDVPSFFNQSSQSYESGWSYVKEDQATSISSVPIIINQSNATLSNIIPADCGDDYVILIKTTYQTLTAYIDGEVIYARGINSSIPFGTKFGATYNIIPISYQYAGKILTLEFASADSITANGILEITSGTKSAVLLDTLQSGLADIILCIITMMMGLVCIILSFILAPGSKDTSGRSLLYLGLFTLFSSIWAFPEIRTIFLFTSKQVPLYLLLYFTFMLSPIPLLLFFKSVFHGGKRLLDFMCLLFLYNFVSQLLLYLFNKIELEDTTLITHILVIFSLCSLLVLALIDIFKYNSKIFEILAGCAGMLTFTIIDTIRYYSAYTDQIGSTYFYKHGLFLLIIALAIYAFRERVAVMNALSEIEVYQHMAYVDGITKLSNRAAYDKELLSLQKGLRSYTSIAFIVFDLNNLKITNDTYGHSAGDELIIMFADSLKKTFIDTGHCYRTGGDEFVVTMVNKSEPEIELILKQLKTAVDIFNMSHPYVIDYACGYAIDMLEHPRPETLYRLLRQADFNMYAQKRIKHGIRVSAEQ